jgi:hypothetical protein
MLASIFMQPPYEAPDEVYRIQKVFTGDAGLYGKLMSQWNIFFEIKNPIPETNIQEKVNSYFSFANNQLLYNVKDGNYSYYLMKIFNLFIVVGFLSIFAFLVSEKTWKQILFSFCLPASIYYLTNITSNFFFIFSSLIAFLLIQRKQYILLFLLALSCALSEDRGCISLIIFSSFYLAGLFFHRIIESRKLFSIVFIVLSIILAFLVKWIILNYTNVVPHGALLKQTIEYNYQFQQNILKRFLAFFMTLWYLTGSVSFRSFVFDYGLFILFFFWAIFTKKTDKNTAIALIAGFSTFIFISTLIQPITQARYYMYILPFLFPAFEALLKKINLSFYMGIFLLLMLTILYSIKVFLISHGVLSLGFQFL